ncbi:Cna B-type domain-containing protein [Parvimonas micra]|uniref:Cna B-type domain-containing protein n=1 Tax=Parvimonas micra TaxID=33033 RepID=A0A9X3HBC9_9FIRM|nr:Cna B-type domain-containing protein [Parvimonas micra]MCZ7408230.1 Cna B-type domain-containing protein [Parvimonas micra]MCZ7410157.1 Cna B-type domain-containing protein [Parvimonas micra]MCZ7411986.1 Cna B-type domain-containing protein [Parvimonas micra]WBB37065.1 Cna B-type domain-containing protein [Parvimonas micra]
MVLSALLPAFRVSAEERGKNISPDVNITKFTIENWEGKEVDRLSKWSRFKIKLDWNAQKYGNTLKNGDYFEVKLPDKFRFIEDSSAIDFPIYGVDGKVYGKGHLDVKKEGGGTLRVTLNEKVENLYNVKGKISMESVFNQDKIKDGEDNTLEIDINGKKIKKKVHIKKPGKIDDEILAKWPNRISDNVNQVGWNVRFNVKGKNFKKVVFEDELTISGGTFDGLHYIKDSFVLQKVKIDEYGNITQIISEKNIGNEVKFSNNNTKFKYELGDINHGEQYFLTYKSTYKPNLTIKNRVKMLAQNESHESSSSYKNAISDGTIEGDLLGKIKIIKVDSENNQLLLKGAKFKITNKKTNETFELVTDEKGEAVSDKLVQGTYEIKEIQAPSGWIKSDEIINVEVKDDVAVIRTVKNKREKTEVSVNKTWIGKKLSSVKVKLLADGKKVDEVTLNEQNNWKHTFTNLNKYKDDGKTEIKYTVEEEKINGYDTEIKENSKNDFTITNKNNEKVKIPVEKKWEDNNNQDGKRVKEIVVRLLQDGIPTTKVLKLNEQNSWKGEFTDLDKYNAQGNEIKYTVKEETVVEGYDTEIIAGQVDGALGYIIKNKHNVEKTEIPVEKKWIGPQSVEQVTVKLFADGVDTGKTLTLKKSENWKGKFTNLDKYKNGKEIVYTIKEAKVEGYESKVEGNAKDGFVITNKNVEKTEIPVEKKWLGKALKEVEVKLLANGKEVQTVKLNEANSWKHTFKNLPKYDDNGKEITYTVKETKVDGYESKVEGNAKDGFVITNKNLAKTEVPVEKKWIGKAVNEIEVKLLANGKEVQTAKLNEANSWKHTFKDLPVYDENGKEITYTVKEVAIEGYESKIEGNAKDGFVITNKNLAKTEVPVEKKWIGKAVNEIEVKLLANGKEVQTAKLNEANSWKHTFKDLPVYDDNGKEITYTVKEVAIEGYESKIEGNAKDGFIITNRNVEKTQVPVEKKWIGKVLKEIEVQLLANGKEIQNIKLNEGNSWKHTFKDLPVYDDNGKEITYTVKETKVEGYESKIEGNAKDGFVITNKEIPKKPRIPKTAVGTQIFGYVAMAGVSLGLLQISRKKRNK